MHEKRAGHKEGTQHQESILLPR